MNSPAPIISTTNVLIIRFILRMALARNRDHTGIVMFPLARPILFLSLDVHTFPFPCQFHQSVAEKVTH